MAIDTSSVGMVPVKVTSRFVATLTALPSPEINGRPVPVVVECKYCQCFESESK